MAVSAKYKRYDGSQWVEYNFSNTIYRHTITLSITNSGATFSIVFNYISSQSSLSTQGSTLATYLKTYKLTLPTSGTYTYGSNQLQVRFIKFSETDGNAIFVYDTSSGGLNQTDISITGATITVTSNSI